MDDRDAYDNTVTQPTALEMKQLKENILSLQSAILIEIYFIS